MTYNKQCNLVKILIEHTQENKIEWKKVSDTDDEKMYTCEYREIKTALVYRELFYDDGKYPYKEIFLLQISGMLIGSIITHYLGRDLMNAINSYISRLERIRKEYREENLNANINILLREEDKSYDI